MPPEPQAPKNFVGGLALGSFILLKPITVKFLIAATLYFAAALPELAPHAKFLAFLYLAYAFLFRYKGAYAAFQQVQKSRFSNGFVDNSINFVINTN